jgi:hypothetical protein
MTPKIYWNIAGQNYRAEDDTWVAIPNDQPYIIVYLYDKVDVITRSSRIYSIKKISNLNETSINGHDWEIKVYSGNRFSLSFGGDKTLENEPFNLLRENFPDDFLALSFYPEVFNGFWRIDFSKI